LDGVWLTYRELGVRLGVNVEAARRRALRARWTRQSGNDGRARILLPEDYEIDRRPDGAPDVRPDASVTIDGPAALAHAFESHIRTLQGDNEALKEQLAAERAAFAARETALEGNLAAERARTDAAISAFRTLADRLDDLAAEHSRRPWWRRLVG
jgi:hypothetical protein